MSARWVRPPEVDGNNPNLEQMHRILIIDDDEDLLMGLEANLLREGYTVLKSTTGDEGLNLAIRYNPDLILLDLSLPGMAGMEVCRQIRQRGLDSPIVLLTAMSAEPDRIAGLEAGANDYITKPFSLKELIARVHARLRRQPQERSETVAHYRFGEIEIDFETFRANIDGRALDLTPREFDMLRFFISRRGEVVTAEELMEEIWPADSLPSHRTVRNQVAKLRKKLEEDPATYCYIVDVPKVGYKFVG